jgi:hypothetical protein
LGPATARNPDPGLSHRQEYYKDEAEDKAAVITIGEEQVQVPLDYFDKDVLMTRDLVPTKPKRSGQASTSAATARSGKVLVREILVAKYVLRACTLKRTFY